MPEHFQPRPLQKDDGRAGFDCGIDILNRYFRDYAWQSQCSGIAKTYVSVDEEGKPSGFYTLSAAAVSHSLSPDRLRKGLPRHDVPMVLLARLAVSIAHQGQGLGAGLLRNALLRAMGAAEIIGARGVVVDAKDDAAASFYHRHGFTPFNGDKMRLFVLFKDIRGIS